MNAQELPRNSIKQRCGCLPFQVHLPSWRKVTARLLHLLKAFTPGRNALTARDSISTFSSQRRASKAALPNLFISHKHRMMESERVSRCVIISNFLTPSKILKQQVCSDVVNCSAYSKLNQKFKFLSISMRILAENCIASS